jgi:capsular polysaccharide biosynthesis protein
MAGETRCLSTPSPAEPESTEIRAPRDPATATEPDVVAGLVRRLREEEPTWGHLPAAMRFKQALVAELGTESAFRVVREVLAVPGTELLRARPVRSMYQVAQDEGLVLTRLWPGGTPFLHPVPKVLGESNHADFGGVNRSGYLACLEDAGIRGRSALILAGGDVLVDFEDGERDRFADNPEYDPGILHAERDVFWTMEPLAPTMEVDEAFMLSGAHTLDFGHWMTEYLPKLAIAMRAGLPRMPLLVDERIPQTHVQSLHLLTPGGAEILTIPHLAPCRVKRLWFSSNPMYMGFYPTRWVEETWTGMATDAARFAALMRTVKDQVGADALEPTGVERVFFARKPERRKKKLLNHPEIESIAMSFGFQVVYPEDLSFREQMRLAHHARFVVAPEGSNSFLAFFSLPGTRVCTLSPTYTFPLADINAILHALDVDCTILTGPMTSDDPDWPFWNDYTVDPRVFRDFLEAWLRDGAPCRVP